MVSFNILLYQLECLRTKMFEKHNDVTIMKKKKNNSPALDIPRLLTWVTPLGIVSGTDGFTAI